MNQEEEKIILHTRAHTIRDRKAGVVTYPVEHLFFRVVAK